MQVGCTKTRYSWENSDKSKNDFGRTMYATDEDLSGHNKLFTIDSHTGSVYSGEHNAATTDGYRLRWNGATFLCHRQVSKERAGLLCKRRVILRVIFVITLRMARFCLLGLTFGSDKLYNGSSLKLLTIC